MIEGEVNVVRVNPKISLHALIGSLEPKTMRVTGTIENTWVTILIDTWSIHNFLDPAKLNRVALPQNNP